MSCRAFRKIAYLFLLSLFFTSCQESKKRKVAQSNKTGPDSVLEQTEIKKTDPRVVPLKESWEFAIPNQLTPQGVPGISAQDCGICHQQHYEEWQYSTHAHAWTDLQFQAELKKDSSPIMCINCHIPLQNQQEFIVEGLIDGDIYNPLKRKNPRFDRKLQQEGINCAGCHVRDGAIIGPTGTSKAPHKTVKDTDHLSEKLCIGCHNAVATITDTLACTFETGDEWKAGPYYTKKNCISCHMEEVQREIVKGFGVRKSRLHYFPGSGIPKRKGAKTKTLNGYSFTSSPLNENFKPKEPFSFTLKLKNEHAGHNVPTGDPERFFMIVFKVKNKMGKIVAEKSHRIGEVWEWHPKAKKISDNNVRPNEERSFTFEHSEDTPGEYTLGVEVTKHRISDEAAEYNKLGDDYPRFISIYKKSFDFKVN